MYSCRGYTWHHRLCKYVLANRVSREKALNLVGFVGAGRHVLSIMFWQGVFRPHANRVRRHLDHAEVKIFSDMDWKRQKGVS
jgi:hypothetical protein